MTSMPIDADGLRLLVTGAQQGDRQAVDRLIRVHEPWVRSAIYAVTGRADWSDDVAQLVWTRVWQRLGTLEDPHRLRAWLYRIARNVALDYAASRRRKQSWEAPLTKADHAPHPAEQSPFGRAAGQETRETILRAVHALPVLYREPFVLRHLEDWSYAQIADVLGLTLEAVETRLVRARRSLREALRGKVQ